MSLKDINTSDFFCKDVIGNVRTAQEDSHSFALKTPNGNVFVVCDGMGGHVGGKQASSIAVKSIIEYLKKEKYSDSKQALNDALQFANMQILGYANEHPELKGMGTTACIVLLQDDGAYIAHVGDSRIYLYLGKQKKLKRITKDHSFVQKLVDAGQITEEEAEHHPNKNIILQALGITPDLEPATGKVLPKNGDVFLICSDGLSGMISDSTMRDVLAQDTSIETKGESLINLALAAGGLDNITLELVQISDSLYTESVYPKYNPATATRKNNKRKLDNNKTILKISAIAAVCVLMGLSLIFKIYTTGKGSIHKSQPPREQDLLDSLQTKLNEAEAERDSIQTLLDNSRDSKAIYIKQQGKLEKEIDSLKEQIKNNTPEEDGRTKLFQGSK